MSPPTTPHLDATDLANFAQEKLSRKKTQRILDHCKRCPGCANKLMEAVREQTPPTPLKLTKWNWISIGFLIVWLFAMVAGVWWLSRSTVQPSEVPIGPETGQQVGRSIGLPPSALHPAVASTALQFGPHQRPEKQRHRVQPIVPTVLWVEGEDGRTSDSSQSADSRPHVGTASE